MSVLSPLRVGAWDLSNRVVMAPMTRLRGGHTGTPTSLNATYYGQRASAGLIITEATDVSAQAAGYAGAPGVWSPEQVVGWRLVTDAVHERGGKIIVQLWHTGRISHPSLQPGGALPIAPSAIAPTGNAVTWNGPQPFVTPRALRLDEIPDIVRQFEQAAHNAREAGFDGVEIHGANGYLIDQFLRDGANHRTDAYGGSPTNRARLLLEVVDTVVSIWGGDRVGLRVSPLGTNSSMSDSDPLTLYHLVAKELNRFGLAFLEVRVALPAGAEMLHMIRQTFRGPLMLNESVTLEAANALIASGEIDLASFARPFISNPDLVGRFTEGAPLAPSDNATWYSGEAAGYTSYPDRHAALAAP